MNLTEAREYFAADRFATEACGITIEEKEPGGALCRMALSPLLANALGNPQGGAIFTLADFAFAVASNSREKVVVSLSNNISFLRPPKGQALYARAKELSATRQTVLYEVAVTDDAGTLVAVMTVNGFRRPIAQGGPENSV
ncbi:MAG: PaaI family thioesterase [Peptococcaceae bacterium]|jgi:acyl-CoA thioesterase|nr:PaaI family thioesterase [Peptococcaceae bacterium]